MPDWKRLLVISVGFGVGFAACAAIVVSTVYWYSTRPKPWNKNALKATFATMEFDTQPQEASYKVHFLYDVQNNTVHSYDLQSANFTILALLAEGSVLSKDFGHHQAGTPTLEGPAFIPAQGKARIDLLVSYEYPSEWTAIEKNDAKKVIKSLNIRLSELKGFVAFDQASHYQIDLPGGWKNWDDVKDKD